jgi:hypothetical protein
MQTWVELFNETAAACQFPLYFGKNYAALFDLLTDFEWSPSPVGYLLCIDYPEFVLDSEEPSELRLLAGLIRDAAETWREEMTRWDVWGKPMAPAVFGAVLHTGRDVGQDPLSRWRFAGANPVPIDQLLTEGDASPE